MGTMTVVDQSGAQLSGIAVTSTSCADTSSALNAIKASFSLTTAFVPVACTTSPIAPNSVVIFQKNSSLNTFTALRVSEISAPSGDTLDYTNLGLIWTFGFSTVVLLWVIARSAGTILEAIRRF